MAGNEGEDKMKFKTKEELIHDSECGGFGEDTRIGISWAFKSFAECVELYKRYKGERYKLMSDKLKLYEKYLASVGNKRYTDGTWVYTNDEVFNDWLFDYCFGEVIE